MKWRARLTASPVGELQLVNERVRVGFEVGQDKANGPRGQGDRSVVV